MKIASLPALVLAFAFPVAATQVSAAELRCPATLGTAAAAPAGFERVGEPPLKPRALGSALIVNGPPGEELASAPATLAPDGEERERGRIAGTWNLTAYRDRGLLLVCRYRDASVYLRTVIPPTYAACRIVPADRNGPAQAVCR